MEIWVILRGFFAVWKVPFVALITRKVIHPLDTPAPKIRTSLESVSKIMAPLTVIGASTNLLQLLISVLYVCYMTLGGRANGSGGIRNSLKGTQVVGGTGM